MNIEQPNQPDPGQNPEPIAPVTGDPREVEVLRAAAMSLLALVSHYHLIECTCAHCKNACNAVFYVPKMRQSAVIEFKKRREVQIKHEKETLRIKPNLN